MACWGQKRIVPLRMWLSGTFPAKGSLLKLGATVDQRIAQKIGRDTMLARIVQMVAEAQRSRAPVQRLVDRVSALFVPMANSLPNHILASASMIMRTDAQQGIFMNIVVGVVGSLLAGFILTPLLASVAVAEASCSMVKLL